ncbi:MAG: hypothetical protein ACP5E5_09165 [Acidobacteriaceae bacterium]
MEAESFAAPVIIATNFTSAPGAGAPLGSVTVPLTLPRPACAHAQTPALSSITDKHNIRGKADTRNPQDKIEPAQLCNLTNLPASSTASETSGLETFE